MPATRVRVSLAVVVLIALAAGTLLLRSRPPDGTGDPAQESGFVPEPERLKLPRVVRDGGYVSSKTCRSCHVAEHDSWHASYHRTMTQVADRDSVVAPFDNRELASRGRRYRLQESPGGFFVEMADPDWEREQLHRGVDLDTISDPPRVSRRVVMTTGSHHFQAYWVQSSGGNQLLNFPFVYHIEDKRWIPREDAFLEPPTIGRHFKTWNHDCIDCHSVAGQPGFQATRGEYVSQVAELGIACEACHGPGEEHVRLHNRLAESAAAATDDPIVNPAKLSHTKSSEVCGQCHSMSIPRDRNSWTVNGKGYRPGDALEEVRHLVTHQDPMFADEPIAQHSFYWADGTMRIGGREYQGMIESACFREGQMTCLSCHSMHRSDPDDQLAEGMGGDRACVQCHDEFADDISQHTHHAPESSGSRCYNCHMPYTSYALFKAIRSHRVDSPSALNSVTTGRPNACNQCHLDQTLSWTARHLNQWYGLNDSLPPESASEYSASLLWLLQGDAAQRVIAAWTMGWQSALEASGTGWQAPFLARLLDDPYSAVRYVAGRSLKRLPGFQDFDYDFVAPADERQQAERRAIEAWIDSAAAPEIDPPRRVLMDADGRVLDDIVNEIERDRDDRPVEIPE